MVQKGYDPNKNLNLLRTRINGLRSELSHIDPNTLAKRTQSRYKQYDQSSGAFSLPMWGNSISISYPGFVIKIEETQEGLDVSSQALVLYHFITTDGVLEKGRWISFAELPDGRFYNSAFQSYTGGELEREFGSNRPRFEATAKILGGRAQPFGDVAFQFLLFPRVPLLAVLWEGDEDFPPSYRILFDASAPNHMPTDACAIAGSMLTRRLIKAS